MAGWTLTTASGQSYALGSSMNTESYTPISSTGAIIGPTFSSYDTAMSFQPAASAAPMAIADAASTLIPIACTSTGVLAINPTTKDVIPVSSPAILAMTTGQTTNLAAVYSPVGTAKETNNLGDSNSNSDIYGYLKNKISLPIVAIALVGLMLITKKVKL